MNTYNILYNGAVRFSYCVAIKSSDYGAATVAKLSLYSTCTRFTVSFGSVEN